MTRYYCDYCQRELDPVKLASVSIPEGDRGVHRTDYGFENIDLCTQCRAGLIAMLRHEPTLWPDELEPPEEEQG